jgi:asparagine synthase (glutamine-hydrolysing)
VCGIAGIVALGPSAAPPTTAELRTMAGALHHRGPDEFGIYRDARAGLAHARLSIIDLATGQQPLSNRDGTSWVVFNGEIFNYVELRAELIALGHPFRTQSDTEVIVHAHAAWGDQAFARFNGQFAIALWDAPRRRLTLARDRLGVRPLHLCQHRGRLYFASEVKAIFAADASIPRAFDPIGIDQTFTFWSVVAPRTVFAGVAELEPGHVRTIDCGADDGAGGEARTAADHDRPFWTPSYLPTFTGSIDDAVEAVGAALERATHLRILRADVPVGSYLSGGLDSSLVAALGVAAKGERLRTFSMRFEDGEYDETPYQRAVVEHLRSEHAEITVSRRDIAAVFPRVIAQTERPILRTAPAPLYLLSQLVRDSGIKVVLTGEGADEMFAGYDLFREAKVRRFWARDPGSRLRPRLLERLYPYLQRSPVSQQAMARHFFGQNLESANAPGFSHDLRWRTTSALKRLFAPGLREALSGADARAALLGSLPDDFARWSLLGQDQYLEVRTLLSGYILPSQGDRMLMGHSVEGRFPFLDREVVDLANALPDEYKLRVLDEKHVLKRLAARLIPESVVRRKKQPYRAPDALSFVGPGAPPWIAEHMSEAAIREAGVFEPAVVRGLWTKCQQRADDAQFSNADNMAVVGVLSTQLLHEQFIASQPTSRSIDPRDLRTLVERTPEP